MAADGTSDTALTRVGRRTTTRSGPNRLPIDRRNEAAPSSVSLLAPGEGWLGPAPPVAPTWPRWWPENERIREPIGCSRESWMTESNELRFAAT